MNCWYKFAIILSCLWLLIGCATLDKTPRSSIALNRQGMGAEQLALYDRAIAKARIVGLGEAHHYSDGVNQVRLELMRHMIQDLGFRAIFIETQELAVNTLRAYINSGCAPMSYGHFGGLFEGWVSRPHRDFFQWLCQYNRKNSSEKVVLFGFDVNSSSTPANKGLRELLNRRARKSKKVRRQLARLNKSLPYCMVGRTPFNRTLEYEKTRRTDLELFRAVYTGKFRPSKKYQESRCSQALQLMRKIVNSDQPNLPPLKFRQALVFLNNLEAENRMLFLQASHLNNPDPRSIQARDQGMANGIKLAIQVLPSDAKVILWAASAHLNKNSSKVAGMPELSTPYGGRKLMGQYLDETFGDQYFVLHISSPRLQMRCSKRYPYCSDETPFTLELDGSFWEQKYAKIFQNKTALILANDEFFKSRGPRFRQSIGFLEASRASEHFDAVYFIPKSPPRQPLPDAPQY